MSRADYSNPSIPQEIELELVSPYECRAMALLETDGWSPDEIAFTFERDARTVRKHLAGDCHHEKGPVTLGDTDV